VGQGTENDTASGRDEVFERIPWEMLEQRRSDRPWLAYGVAGAIVLGALAYSVMANRPVTPAVSQTVHAEAPASDPATSQTPAVPPVVATGSPPTAPTMTAEADLYAVNPERVIDQAVAYAEWFTSEYLSVDGSEESRQVLASLLPSDIPPPQPGEGMRVFVEWVRASTVEEVAPLVYRVSVLARTLAADSEGLYVRQPPQQVIIDVSMAGDGPTVTMSPEVEPLDLPEPVAAGLVEVPEEIRNAALGLEGTTEVVGGVPTPEGSWRVVVMATGADGVLRPRTVVVP
jgi:hypothetical protein